jgi:hypothetical protein
MRASWLTRRAVLQGLGAAALAGGAASLGLLLARRSNGHKEWTRPVSLPSASSSWVDRVRELHQRIDQEDFVGAAKAAGYLTDEAFTAADRVVQAWLASRDKYLGFLPRTIDNDKNRIWNYKDCAADIYCHFVIEASLIAPRHLGALRDILAKERAITEGVPRSIRLDSGEVLSETLDERIFGAVEYAKDGLLPILERVGPSEWLDRLHEVVHAIVHASPVQTRYGALPSENTETNGQFLQVLARLYRRERRPEYLAAGRALADAYVQEILPFGHGLPAGTWAFDTHLPRVRNFRLRDHGNEIVSGLAEWVMAETEAPDNRAAQYRPDVERMMDTLLGQARDAAGLWSDRILPAGQVPLVPPAQPVNDNWGYLTAGYVGYALSLSEDSLRRKRYLDESTRAFTAAIQYRGAAWQDGAMDGYADSIEGAQYLLPFLKIDGAARWVDDEMGILLAYQAPDGFVGRTYLDGNFVRTALLYALFRTQGARLDPWRPGVRLGGIMSSEGLHVAIDSDAPWSGRIVFDSIRHREHLNLPFEYPRLNGWTEWFTVDPEVSYKMTRSVNGQASESKVVDGKELIDGMVVDGPEGGLVLLLKAA